MTVLSLYLYRRAAMFTRKASSEAVSYLFILMFNNHLMVGLLRTWPCLKFYGIYLRVEGNEEHEIQAANLYKSD